MKWKTEWRWLTGFALASVLLVGFGTGFTFSNTDLQLHDTYYTADPLRAVVLLTLILWSLKNTYLAADLLTGRYNILAIFAALSMPVVILLAGIYLYTNFLKGGSANLPQVVLAALITALIVVSVLIEVSALRKVLALIRNHRQQ